MSFKVFTDIFTPEYWSAWVDRTFSPHSEDQLVSVSSPEWKEYMMNPSTGSADVASSAAAPSSEFDSYNILDMVNKLNAIDRENADASIAAQKELLALQNEMNSASSELAWERYKEYDSTKVQRYVEDMKSAGINPIIAFGSSGMPNITSASPSASSVSPWTAQKASAHGESAIGKYQQLVQGYIGMVASLLETGISTAGNVVSSVIGKGTPAPVRTGTSRNYYKGGYSEQYFYQ